MCQDIVELDSTIIFASLGSLSGQELARHTRPSKDLLIGDDKELGRKCCSIVAVILNSCSEAEVLFGKCMRLVENFERNLKIIVVPIHSKKAFLLIVSTRDSDEKGTVFRASKILERFLVKKDFRRSLYKFIHSSGLSTW